MITSGYVLMTPPGGVRLFLIMTDGSVHTLTAPPEYATLPDGEYDFNMRPIQKDAAEVIAEAGGYKVSVERG